MQKMLYSCFNDLNYQAILQDIRETHERQQDEDWL
jgi:hypothetical protein